MSRPRFRPADDLVLDQLFGALADATRRSILCRLTDGPAPISVLAAPFDMSLAAVGKHVKILESVGLVQRRIVGRARICALNPHALHAAEDWLAFYRDFWTDGLDALAEYVESMNDD